LPKCLLLCRLCLSLHVGVSMVEHLMSFPWAVTRIQLVVLALWFWAF
jgi:hypothetical protein